MLEEEISSIEDSDPVVGTVMKLEKKEVITAKITRKKLCAETTDIVDTSPVPLMMYNNSCIEGRSSDQGSFVFDPGPSKMTKCTNHECCEFNLQNTPLDKSSIIRLLRRR